MKREAWFYGAAFVSGIAVWIAVSAASGREEAWDSSLYFSAGIPAICAVSMALAFFAPVQSWRWGLTPLAGQFLWLLLSQGVGNLLPLGVVAFGLFSVPAILAARAGAFLGNKWARSNEP